MRTLSQFRSDSGGSVIVLFALTASILIGAIGFAVDVGLWDSAHRKMQDAADSAAVSAIVGSDGGVDVKTQAKAVAASYNFVNGVAGATVTANRPPLSGSNTSNTGAVEVIVSQPQARLFSLMFGSRPVNESARAVAIPTANACILALNQTISGAVSAQGAVAANANGCSIYSDSNDSTSSVSAGGGGTISASQIGAVGGFYGQSNMTAVNGFNHGGVLPDPYGYVTPPAMPTCVTLKQVPATLYPGAYCGGFNLNNSDNVTMMPGVYYIDQGTLTVNGGATLTGTGVTIVFTSSTGSNYATAKFAGGANVSLSAPTSGATAGIVLFGDRNMPVGTGYDLEGGSGLVLSGVVYLRKGAVNFAGGTSNTNGCTQIVADSVSFVGNSSMALTCPPSYGIHKIGAVAQLVE